MELFVKCFVKYALHACNCVILIYGIFLTVMGFMILRDLRSFEHFLESKIFWLPHFIIFNGIMMLVLSVLGLVATVRQDYKLLVTFAISALIVLLIEIALVTWASSQNTEYAENMRASLRRSFSNYLFDEKDRKSWDKLQKMGQCCGIEGPQNWGAHYTRNQVPASCCLIAPDQTGALCLNTKDPKIVHQYGCHQILYKRVTDHWSVLSLLAQISAVLQFAVLFCSVAMGFLVKRAKISRERQ